MPFLAAIVGLAVAGGAIGAIGVVAIGIGLTAAEHALAPHHDVGGQQLQFSADKNAGVPYLMGRTATGGNIVFEDTSNDGHNKWVHYFVVFSTGPVDSFQSFIANQTTVSFSGGAATTSPYNGKMWLTTQVGAQPSTLLTAPSGTGTVPEWTSTCKLSGLAAGRWVLQSDQTAYAAGPPQPLWVWKGVKCYDPRLDSTYPGGSGSQRSNDATTWAWSENPYIHALTFCLGQTSNGVRTIGLGAPVTSIDVAAFVAGANVAAANNWKVGGVITSQDSKWDVLTAILQAGGGIPVRQGNLISCLVNTPLVSVATLTGADVVGQAQIQGSQPRRTRINSITPTYRSESHNWEQVSADPVTISAYVTADGQKRSKAVTYSLVQQVTQAAQLAYYDIVNAREFGDVVLPLKPRWNGLKPGDCITLNENELGMTSQTLLIMSRQRDPSTGFPTITCRSETTAKHAAALSLSGNPPPTPSLSAIDLSTVAAPGSGVWSVSGVTLTDSTTGQQTGVLRVTGSFDNPNASNAIIQYSPAGAGTWSSYVVPPSTGTVTVDLPGATPNASYDVQVAYVQRGVVGTFGTATGSPATTGQGGTFNQIITFTTSNDSASYNYTGGTGTWVDCTSIHIGYIKLGGAFYLSLTGSWLTPNTTDHCSWRIVTRNHVGGGDQQVITSASPAAQTIGALHGLVNYPLIAVSTMIPNPATTAGDKDLVLQFQTSPTSVSSVFGNSLGGTTGNTALGGMFFG